MVNDQMVNGFYVHIPFCKKRCLYCDFFSTTLLQRRKEYVDAVVKEIEQRKYEDICQIMGINYQSVRNLMHRSISKLRELTAKVSVNA